MKALLPALTLLILGGCGTSMNLGVVPCGKPDTRVFGGVMIAAKMGLIIDVPVSFAFDVLTLPFTIPAEIERTDRPELVATPRAPVEAPPNDAKKR